MKCACFVVLIASGLAYAQQPIDEVAALQARIEVQQARLRAQRQELDLLKNEFEESDLLAKSFLQERAPAILAALSPTQPTATPQPSKPIPAAPKPPAGIHIPISAGQEIATAENDDTAAFHLGPVDVRILGYVGLTSTFRSATMGGSPGTSFTSIPLNDTPAGSTSEFRNTVQTSRMALRLDVPLGKDDRFAGYVETDFNGISVGNALISSSSYGFRVRHAWADYRHGKFEAAAGQMFSLMTPSKADVQTWPSDALTTQAVDTNYVAGLVWIGRRLCVSYIGLTKRGLSRLQLKTRNTSGRRCEVSRRARSGFKQSIQHRQSRAENSERRSRHDLQSCMERKGRNKSLHFDAGTVCDSSATTILWIFHSTRLPWALAQSELDL